MDSAPPPQQPSGGMRLSGLALTGIIILSLLLGCIGGSMLAGVGGFLTGRTLAQRDIQSLQNQLQDAQRRSTQPGAAATATPGRSGATGQATPQTQPTQRPGGAATPSSGAAPSGGATPRAQQPTAYLGVRYNMLTPDIAAQAGITVTQGAIIGEVVPGSPAEQAGLQPMDVITAVDGKQLGDTYALADAISGRKPGDKINLTVVRDGQTVALVATLGQPPAGGVPAPGAPGGAPAAPTGPGAAPATPRPPASGQPSGGATPQAAPKTAPSPTPRPPSGATPQRPSSIAPSQDGGAYLGIQASAVPSDVAQARKLSPGQGALVASVVPASPAFSSGLFDGDIIVAVNKTPVDQVHSLTTLLSPHKPGDQVTLTVIHSDGKKDDMTVTLAARSAEFNQGRPGLP
ncbi:MAG: PDZ domain-containing protein [Anaerolineae bacterium]